MAGRAAVVKFEIDAADWARFNAKLLALGPKADQAMSVSVRQEAERIMERSKSQVPVDTGTLKGSAHVGIPHRVTNGVEVEFGYGGPAARYALYQHFGSYRHTHGKAHFLDEPVKWARRGLTARVRAVLERYFR